MTEPAAYYNEIDPVAAHVLRAQIAAGVIAPGDVDERSIKDVQPDDLKGYTQCHFFAGGGLWSVAARIAGFPDDRKLWTGSCPCQGESLAGKRLGAADPRDLWPDFRRLIRAVRPPVVMGEQVAAAAGTHWLDRTSADLDADDYAFRAVDIPACAVDAPHQRNRLYWVAADNGGRGALGHNASVKWREYDQPRRIVDNGQRARLERLDGHGDRGDGRTQASRPVAAPDGGAQSDANSCGRYRRQESAERGASVGTAAERAADELFGDANSVRELQSQGGVGEQRRRYLHANLRNGSFWSDAEWIVSPIDGKARRSYAGVRSLAYGLPGGLASLRDEVFSDAAEKVIEYAYAEESRPGEILRAVREAVLSSQAREAEESWWWHGHRLGGPERLHAAEILLAYVRELNWRFDAGRGLFAVSKEARGSVRSVRGAIKPAQSSCRRQLFQQFGPEPSDALRELSRILAFYAEKAGASAGATYASGLGFLIHGLSRRVDLWRIGGNAIVPQVAAEVIAAFLDAELAQ